MYRRFCIALSTLGADIESGVSRRCRTRQPGEREDIHGIYVGHRAPRPRLHAFIGFLGERKCG